MIILSQSALPVNGTAQIELSPSLTTLSSNSGTDNQYTNGLYKLNGKAFYDWNNNKILVQGECSKSGVQDSKADCMLGEAYGELGLSDSLTLKAGKSSFDVSSNPILTSPMNPSTSGLTSLSPFIPQEGIWSASLNLFPDQIWSFQLGSATDFIKAYPFAVVKSHLGKFDFAALGTETMLGASGSVQLTDSVLVYSEGNTMRDFLTGFQYTFNLIGKESTRFSCEYFYNFNGVGNANSDDRFSYISDYQSVKHEEQYQFPTPKSMDTSPWGPMSFMSQDLLLFDIRNTTGQLVPSFTNIISLNDYSWMSISGLEYHFNNLKSKLSTLNFRLEWRHFQGIPGLQEFGEVSKVVGSNQLWLSVQI